MLVGIIKKKNQQMSTVFLLQFGSVLGILHVENECSAPCSQKWAMGCYILWAILAGYCIKAGTTNCRNLPELCCFFQVPFDCFVSVWIHETTWILHIKVISLYNALYDTLYCIEILYISHSFHVSILWLFCPLNRLLVLAELHCTV